MKISLEPAVDQLIQAHIKTLETGKYGPQSDQPFVVADLDKVSEQHRRWKLSLPEIQPFYAVKCNSDPTLLRALDGLRVNFDCASLEEIRLVLQLGVCPSRIVFAHPCKAVSALRFAAQQGVRMTTFDNLDELDKIKAHSPELDLLLRIYAQDDGAIVRLSRKFGAHSEATPGLLKRAKALGLRIVGVSFHIGSKASDPSGFAAAVMQARRVFDQGKRLGFPMTILDIGGGFQDNNFEPMAAGLQQALDREFAGVPVGLIGEPGRFYASGFYTLVCRVISRRKQHPEARRVVPEMLYQNDGVYGSFSAKWAEDANFTPIPLVPTNHSHRAQGLHQYSVWGPTCDGIDLVVEDVTLDREVQVGDWLVYQNMGAYSTCLATRFNGFPSDYTILYRGGDTETTASGTIPDDSTGPFGANSCSHLSTRAPLTR